MPWLPELFSAPVLQQILDKRRRDKLVAVPYFDGLMAGDPDPLVESFAGEPEVHDPMRGRIKGVAAFRAFVTETSAWLRQHHASVEDVEHVILERRGFEEVVLHLDTDNGTRRRSGRCRRRPPPRRTDRRAAGLLLEPATHWPTRDPAAPPASRPWATPVRRRGRVLARVRQPATLPRSSRPSSRKAILRDAEGRQHSREGPDGVSAYYQRLFSTGGGIPLESCALVDDGRNCVLEYNVVGWGATRLPPRAGAGVFVRGHGGRLAAVRLYDDTIPPLGRDA